MFIRRLAACASKPGTLPLWPARPDISHPTPTSHPGRITSSTNHFIPPS
jgi:hypothetical protein